MRVDSNRRSSRRSQPEYMASSSVMTPRSNDRTPPDFLLRNRGDGSLHRLSPPLISMPLSFDDAISMNVGISPNTIRHDVFETQDPVSNILSELELEDDKNTPFVLIPPSEVAQVVDDRNTDDANLMIPRDSLRNLNSGSTTDQRKRAIICPLEDNKSSRPIVRARINRFNLKPRPLQRQTEL